MRRHCLCRDLLAALCSLLVGAGCRDVLTGPGPTPPETIGRAAEQVLGTYAFGVPAFNEPQGGAVGWTYTGMTIPAYATAVITVTGTIDVGRNPLHECCFGTPNPNRVGSYDAWGIPTGPPWAELKMMLGPGNGSSWTLRQDAGGVRTDTMYFGSATQVWVARNGVAGGSSCIVSPPAPPSCVCPGGFCYSYAATAYTLSGSQVITVTQIDDHLRLTPSKAKALPGTMVSFTASTTNGAPLAVDGWSWVPDSGTANTAACTHYNAVCNSSINQNGTMRVVAWVLGARRVATAHVQLGFELSVEASPTDPWEGDSVTFTATSSVALPNGVDAWYWVPAGGGVIADPSTSLPAMGGPTVNLDGPPGGVQVCLHNQLTCQIPVNGSGTMHVSATAGGFTEIASVEATARSDSATLTANPAFGGPGTPVTFTAQRTSGRPPDVLSWRWVPLTGSAVNNPCPAGTTTCNMTVQSSGTMECSVRIGGRTVGASAAVSIYCPTDSLLTANPSVRHHLEQELAASKPDAPESERVELLGVIWRNPEGEIVVEVIRGGPASNCGASPPGGLDWVDDYIVSPHSGGMDPYSHLSHTPF